MATLKQINNTQGKDQLQKKTEFKELSKGL
jgi:hypothetical protein